MKNSDNYSVEKRKISALDLKQADCLLIMCLGKKRCKIESNKCDQRFALFKYKVIVLFILEHVI